MSVTLLFCLSCTFYSSITRLVDEIICKRTQNQTQTWGIQLNWQQWIVYQILNHNNSSKPRNKRKSEITTIICNICYESGCIDSTWQILHTLLPRHIKNIHDQIMSRFDAKWRYLEYPHIVWQGRLYTKRNMKSKFSWHLSNDTILAKLIRHQIGNTIGRNRQRNDRGIFGKSI